MLKIFLLLLATSCSYAANIPTADSVIPYNLVYVDQYQKDLMDKWAHHIKDFTDMVDTSALVSVVLKHIDDVEVMAMLSFITGTEFQKVVLDFESIDEFHEAVEFLAVKGYDAVSLVNLINSYLNLHPYVPPKRGDRCARSLATFFEELLKVLPAGRWKELLDDKLQNSNDVKVLADTVMSPEFKDILKRLSTNPKLKDIKQVLINNGFDVTRICQMVHNMFGEEYFLASFCN